MSASTAVSAATSTTILFVRPAGDGWGPIAAMARLIARLLQAELVEVEDRTTARSEKIRLLLPRLRGGERLLVIAPVPRALDALVRLPGLRRRYGEITGWVVDCWWTDRIPISVTRGRLYDRLLVTEKEVVGQWARATGLPVEWMPLGADVLAAVREHGRAGEGERPVDLQRMGRQPAAWDDDAVIGALCAERGIVYGARPPFGATPEESYANVLAADAAARTLLAFTNLASPAGYTHPTREYVTSRWLDALARGTLVVGRRPREEGSDRLLWEGATVDLDVADPAAGLDVLAGVLADWSPARAEEIQSEALRRIDWRLRVRDLAALLDVSSPVLDSELREVGEAAR